jgi:hypothetical protein
MTEEVKIDKQVFEDRLSQFITAWKIDKRSNDAVFGGVGSIVILMGKNNEQTITFQKNNAMHVNQPQQTLGKIRDIDDLPSSSGFLAMNFRRPCFYLPWRRSIL